jgi:hypothetical protein
MFKQHVIRQGRATRWHAALLLAAVVSGCAAADADRNANAGESPLKEVRQLVGLAACESDSDCRTIAVGDKACGGPEAYVAWSIRHTDAQALALAATRYTQARRTQNEQPTGRVSNCAWVSDPGAHCAAGGSDGAPSTAQATAAPRRCTLHRGGIGRPVD